MVDGAETAELSGYDRVVYLFDGRDETAVAKAREQWKAAKGAAARSPTGSSRAKVAGRRRPERRGLS
jgi:DNA polymerase-3 subunit chi